MLSTIVNKRLYKHHCEDCIYLGSNEIVDFYFCNKLAPDFTSLVIRLSDKPDDYCSMPASVAEQGILSGEINGSVFDACYQLYKNYLVNKDLWEKQNAI